MTIHHHHEPFPGFLYDKSLNQRPTKLSKSQIKKNAIHAIDAMALTQFDINHTPANYKLEEYVHKNVRNARGYMGDKHYTIAKIFNFNEQVYQNLSVITQNLLPELADNIRMQLFINEQISFEEPTPYADATLIHMGEKQKFSFCRHTYHGSPWDGLDRAFFRFFTASPFAQSLAKLIEKNFGGYRLMDIKIFHSKKSKQFMIDWGHYQSDALNLYLFFPSRFNNPTQPAPTIEILNPEIKQAFFAQDSYNIIHPLETFDQQTRARMNVPMEIFKMPLYQKHQQNGTAYTRHDIKNRLFMMPGVRSWEAINKSWQSSRDTTRRPLIYHNSGNECAWRLNSESPVTLFKIELRSAWGWRIH